MDSPDNGFIFQEIVAVKSFSAFPKIPLRPNFPLYLQLYEHLQLQPSAVAGMPRDHLVGDFADRCEIFAF